jgi:hypothetical protein
MSLQNRESELDEILVRVVEREKHRPARQGHAFAQPCKPIGRAYTGVSVA